MPRVFPAAAQFALRERAVLRRQLRQRDARIAQLEAALAEANAWLDRLIKDGLEVDDARENLLHVLSDNLTDMQAEVDSRSEALDLAMEALGESDDRIQNLENALLTQGSTARQ
jgi:recombinational DNA repair ATPase RecF